MVGERRYWTSEAGTTSAMADFLPSHAAFLSCESEGNEGSGAEGSVGGAEVIECGGTELKGDVLDEERMTVAPRVAVFAWAHKEEEGDPQEIYESERLGCVEASEVG